MGEVESAAPANPSLSPNGRLLALSHAIGGNADIWTVDVTRGALNRVTGNDATDNFPVWSPDGRELVFGSNRSAVALDLYRTTLGSGNERLLLSTDQIKDAEDWSRDGEFVLYRSVDLQTRNDLWALPMDGGGKPIPIARTTFDERGGQFSPDDGRWVAYNPANRSGVAVFGVNTQQYALSADGQLLSPECRRRSRSLSDRGGPQLDTHAVKERASGSNRATAAHR